MRPKNYLKIEKYSDTIDEIHTNRWVGYYKGDDLHREDGPAIVWDNGEVKWYYNGLLHRDFDKPATTSFNCNTYYVHGILHREDGPAIEYTDDVERCKYFLNGVEYTKEDYINESRLLKLKKIRSNE